MVEARAAPGAAVISSRRLHLGARLLHAGVGARFLLPQTASPGAQLPPLRPLRVILPVCPSIYAVLADTEDLRLLSPLIRLGGLCGTERLQTIGPYWIGVPPIQRPPLSLEHLEILVAMARSENIDDAVERSGMARRTFYRRLARLRAALNLPPATHGTRIEELVTSMITALTHLGQSLSTGDATSPRA